MRILKDEDIPSVQKAVYWTEYVIRHNGANHLKNPLRDEPIWKIYMLDVYGMILASLAIMFYVSSKIIRFTVNLFIVRKKFGKIHLD